MPLYDFSCARCGEEFEELVSAGESPDCPKCSSSEIERKLPVFAIGGSQAMGAGAAEDCGTCGDPRGPGA